MALRLVAWPANAAPSKGWQKEQQQLELSSLATLMMSQACRERGSGDVSFPWGLARD
jgi:hypothetical protein